MHVKQQYYNIRSHLAPFLKDKALGEITKQDVRDFMTTFSKTSYTYGAENAIVRADVAAIKLYYINNLLDKDVTACLIFFSGIYND